MLSFFSNKFLEIVIKVKRRWEFEPIIQSDPDKSRYKTEDDFTSNFRSKMFTKHFTHWFLFSSYIVFRTFPIDCNFLSKKMLYNFLMTRETKMRYTPFRYTKFSGSFSIMRLLTKKIVLDTKNCLFIIELRIYIQNY